MSFPGITANKGEYVVAASMHSSAALSIGSIVAQASSLFGLQGVRPAHGSPHIRALHLVGLYPTSVFRILPLYDTSVAYSYHLAARRAARRTAWSSRRDAVFLAKEDVPPNQVQVQVTGCPHA